MMIAIRQPEIYTKSYERNMYNVKIIIQGMFMKLKLIAPKSYAEEAVNPFPPYVLLVLASLSPNWVEVTIEDENVEDINFEESVDLVGITVIMHNAQRAFDIADVYRKKGVKVFMGGIFAESNPDDCLMHADSVIVSEVEDMWEDILNDFKTGNYLPKYQAVKRPEISDRPIPRHDLIKDKPGYFSKNLIMISRGCPNRCEYCSSGLHWKGQIKTRNLDEIIREIELLDPSKPIMFIDDNLIWSKDYAKELFRALIPLKRKWISCGSCIDSVEDSELVYLAKESGCSSMLFGFETINSEALKTSQKGFNQVEKYNNTIEIFHKLDIAVLGTFIFGLDGETYKTFENTVQFIKDSEIDMVNLNMLYPYPGTPFRERLKRENRLIEHEYENEWNTFAYNKVMFRPKNMTVEELSKGFEYSVKELSSREICAKRVSEAIKHNRYPEYVFNQNMKLRQHVTKMYGEY